MLVIQLLLAKVGLGYRFFSVVFGRGGRVIIQKFSFLLVCAFPETLARASRLLLRIFVFASSGISGIFPASVSPHLEHMRQKQNIENLPPCHSLVLQFLSQFSFFFTLFRSSWVCFTYNFQGFQLDLAGIYLFHLSGSKIPVRDIDFRNGNDSCERTQNGIILLRQEGSNHKEDVD